MMYLKLTAHAITSIDSLQHSMQVLELVVYVVLLLQLVVETIIN